MKDTHRLPDGAPSQDVVCFSETPLEHIWTQCARFDGRRKIELQPYGLAFTKAFGRRNGVNPVWYTDISPTGNEWLMNAINALVDHACSGCIDGTAHQVFRLTPFIEQMGPTTQGTQKEFWWEREWRHGGDFPFPVSSVFAILSPASDHEQIRELVGELVSNGDRPPPVLDPSWSPERMLAALSGLTTDAGPIPDRET